MGNRSRYSQEVRERGVRMVLEHEGEYASRWEAVRSIASKLGCSAETLRSWVKQAEVDSGRRPGLSSDERSRMKELEREVRELRHNALAETINGLYKAELIRRHGPWRGLEEVEFATLEWVNWFNNRRLLEPIGRVPPAEFEVMYYEARKSQTREVGLN